MRSPIYHCLLSLATVGVYFNSCQSTTPQDQSSELQADQFQQQQDQQSLADENVVNEDPVDEGKIKLLHPKEPTAWFTRRLLMTTQQPSATRINQCRVRVESNAGEAPNLRALDEVALTLESAADQNIKLYHWCFYQMMADLDLKLETNAPLMEDKAEVFLKRMRSLWTMARALDSVSGGDTYMRYLRARYTELSQSQFGRNLEIVDPNTFSLPTGGPGKSAARFEE